MLYILTTNPGIEDIVGLEVKEKLNTNIEKFLGFAGKVIVNTNRLDRLLTLRSIYHIIRYVDAFELCNLEDVYTRLEEIDIEEIKDA